MTMFGQRIEPITFQTPGGCANSYATDAGIIVACLFVLMTSHCIVEQINNKIENYSRDHNKYGDWGLSTQFSTF